MKIKIEEDPRPDLAEDSVLWRILLTVARQYQGGKLFGLMHGLRCGGSRLVWESKAPPTLKLNTDVLLRTMGRDALVEKWLKPNQADISYILAETALKASKLKKA